MHEEMPIETLTWLLRGTKEGRLPKGEHVRVNDVTWTILAQGRMKRWSVEATSTEGDRVRVSIDWSRDARFAEQVAEEMLERLLTARADSRSPRTDEATREQATGRVPCETATCRDNRCRTPA